MPAPLLPVTIPDVGAAGLPMRLSAWFVEPGDAVDLGDSLCEVLITGVTCDVTAACAGRLARIDKGLDAPVAPGTVVAWIETSRADDEGRTPLE